MTNFCCEVFPKIVGHFYWFNYKEKGNAILCMPYIQVGSVKYRVNNCPSCGKEVRDFKISLEEFSKL